MFQQTVAMALQRFHVAFPSEALDLSEMNFAEQGQALAAGDLGVGLVGMEHEPQRLKLPHEPFSKHEIFIALSKQHPAARKSKVPLASLASDMFVGISEQAYPGAWETAIKLCTQAGVRPKYLQVAENAFAAMNLVSAGLAVAFMSEQMKRVMQDSVMLRPFDPPIVLDLYVAWKRGAPTAAMKEFIRIVKEVGAGKT